MSGGPAEARDARSRPGGLKATEVPLPRAASPPPLPGCRRARVRVKGVLSPPAASAPRETATEKKGPRAASVLARTQILSLSSSLPFSLLFFAAFVLFVAPATPFNAPLLFCSFCPRGEAIFLLFFHLSPSLSLSFLLPPQNRLRLSRSSANSPSRFLTVLLRGAPASLRAALSMRTGVGVFFLMHPPPANSPSHLVAGPARTERPGFYCFDTRALFVFPPTPTRSFSLFEVRLRVPLSHRPRLSFLLPSGRPRPAPPFFRFSRVG